MLIQKGMNPSDQGESEKSVAVLMAAQEESYKYKLHYFKKPKTGCSEELRLVLEIDYKNNVTAEYVTWQNELDELSCSEIEKKTFYLKSADTGCDIKLEENSVTQKLEIKISNCKFNEEIPTLESFLQVRELNLIVNIDRGKKAVLCGEPGNSCYESDEAMNLGYAYTSSGKILTYVDADGSGSESFKIWIETVEFGSANVLSATGLDSWQMKLNPDGRAHSESYLTVNIDSSNNISGTSISIRNRVCPPNVFYDANGIHEETDFYNTGMCLYYAEMPGDKHSYNDDISIIGTTGAELWTGVNTGKGAQDSWYETNHIECALSGMRLPTLFETNVSRCNNGTYDLFQCPRWPRDATPIFASTTGNGIPPHGGTWTMTASAGLLSTRYYWLFGGGATGTHCCSNYYDKNKRIICTIP